MIDRKYVEIMRVVLEVLAFLWIFALQAQIIVLKGQYQESKLSNNTDIIDNKINSVTSESNTNIQLKLSDLAQRITYQEITSEAFKNSISNIINEQNSKINDQSMKFTEYITQQDLNSKKMTQTIDLLTDKISQFSDLQKKFTEYSAQQDITNQNTIKAIDVVKSEKDKIKDYILTVAQNIPNTILYGPYVTQNWGWQTFPKNGDIFYHPTSSYIYIPKKSVVTFVFNGLWVTHSQYVQVLFFKDRQPIVNRHQQITNYFPYSYFSNQFIWTSISFTQEAIIEAGTYLFEAGIVCQENCSSKEVSINGLGYTIKVQELVDLTKIYNQNF